LGQIGGGRFHHQVIVIIQQHVRMDQHSEALNGCTHQFEKMRPVAIIPEEGAALQAARRDVIPAGGKSIRRDRAMSPTRPVRTR